ncbi:MAG: OmpA family protein [Thermodesulfovibrionales bacterium]
MRRNRERDHENSDRWIVSYADFITLLFAFFTTMYAISHVDSGKLEEFAGSVRSALRAEGGAQGGSLPAFGGISAAYPDPAGIEERLRKAIGGLDSRQAMGLRSDERGVVLSIGDRVLFDSGGAEIKESATQAIAAVAGVIAAVPNDVAIEGHTDSVPISNSRYPSNWELSTARAASVLEALVARHGLPPERFSVAGYAEFRPVAPNETPEGRAKNRRVDIIILREK